MNQFKKIYKNLENYLPIISVIFFLLGIWIASKSVGFAKVINRGMLGVVDIYQYLAPIIIFIILTPALSKILLAEKTNGSKFVGQTIFWFAKLRLLACFWGVVFTAIVFGLPLFINGGIGLGESILQTLKSIGWTLISSSYFYGVYAAILTVTLSFKIPKISRFLDRCSEGIEKLGKYLVPLVPLFMLVVGAYVYYLPQILPDQIANNGGTIAHLNNLRVFGFNIPAHTATGIILAYVAGGLLTGLACMMWHFGLLFFTKLKEREFSIKDYFKNYWVKSYPLMWATSSETLAIPLDLYLVKKYYPQVKSEIRRFIIGVGCFLNINGTIICVFILAGLVAALLGIQISLVQLVLIIPLVFLIGYSIPGIPGELLLFAGPIAVLLAIPESVIPIFLAIYFGFQLGLPDSFRTGANTTDNCVCAILRNKTYKEKFVVGEELARKGLRERNELSWKPYTDCQASKSH